MVDACFNIAKLVWMQYYIITSTFSRSFIGYTAALHELGVKSLLVTSSVGVLHRRIPLFTPMLLTDLLMPYNTLPDGSTCTMFTDSKHPHAVSSSKFISVWFNYVALDLMFDVCSNCGFHRCVWYYRCFCATELYLRVTWCWEKMVCSRGRWRINCSTLLL